MKPLVIPAMWPKNVTPDLSWGILLWNETPITEEIHTSKLRTKKWQTNPILK